MSAPARQACVSCHSQKRKCGRQLPRCDLCQKKGRACEYPPEALPDPPERRLPGDEFPALFFLDTWLFRNRGLAVPSARANPPGHSHFQALLAQESVLMLKGAAERYFAMVHPSFPVLSRLKINRYLDSPAGGTQADMALLLMAVRLLSLSVSPTSNQTPRDRESLPLYRRAKECYAALEMQGVITPVLLQAVLLLAYWEVGHAVYPAAFLSVGLCARLGQALGIHKQRREATIPMYADPTSAIETEEQRRIWWGVVTLDRYVTAGMTGRSFACGDLQPEDLLPMLERPWDLGEPSVAPSLAACGDASRPVSAFARTCQAAHLLSRVVHHVNEPPGDARVWYQDGMRLHYVVDAFSSGLASELAQPHLSMGGESPAYPALGLAYTAQVLLYDAHACANFDQPSGVGTQEQLAMQEISLSGLRAVCPAVSRFATTVRTASRSGDAMAMALSPLLMSCMYEAGKYCFWYYRETLRPELLAEVQEIMHTLRMLAETWPLAGQYVSILEGDEFCPDRNDERI
ncbi:hypothetical protein B0T14DRAFT_517942 [Immersiella caudata]|uniref:Zn(2)-C6 fungal-type domain-containing protein n=1 Tax=Immersiella caudata TaxID=314043 RepID=A0AA40C4F1_9PEZI|nr:hypothetical protein B0T14DRAFT_517942 [Immersiella caudata]